MPNTHTVNWTTMANYTTDLWNVNITQPYTVTLKDSMTVSTGNQYLTITGFNNTIGASWYPWKVFFVNSTYYYYETHITYSNGSSAILTNGYAYCTNGLVTLQVSQTQITFIGKNTTVCDYPTFIPIEQIRTLNGDGNFNGGHLDMTLTN
jgi:hypothetical protein